MLTLNHKAPDFKLFNTEKKAISLEEQKGKNVVLLFFPLAFTSTCTAELCNIRDNYSIYNDLNATVFGISADSLFTLKKFREEQKLNFDLLSDFNKTTCQAYDCLYQDWAFEMKGVPKRASFVIDKEGVLRYSEILEAAGTLPDFNGIINTLKKLN